MCGNSAGLGVWLMIVGHWRAYTLGIAFFCKDKALSFRLIARLTKARVYPGVLAVLETCPSFSSPVYFQFLSVPARIPAKISIPSQRFCRRRFSLAPCWLLLWLAMGRPTTGVFSKSGKRYMGMLPPSRGILTIGAPRVSSIERMTGRTAGSSSAVRAALYPAPQLTLITLACWRRVSRLGAWRTM